jgi:Domain of unknown function (DUF932)
VWVLATLPDQVEVGGDDVRRYVLLMNSHDGSTAVIAATTPVRVVCQNTLNWGLGSAQQKFSIRHTEAVTQRVHELFLRGETRGNAPGSKWAAVNAIVEYGDYLQRPVI